MDRVEEVKDNIRRMVYKRLLEAGVARPPYPIEGRIPNFVGAEEAAIRLASMEEFLDAHVYKVNPDSPQKPVRRLILERGGTLIMPTPRIKKGFLILKRRWIGNIDYASTIRGAFKYGRFIDPERIPHIDFIVEGSVAVSMDGMRLGKGEGYAELEYAILLEYGAIEPDIPIATTVHPLQLVNYIPREVYDVSIDYIVTPEKVIRCRGYFRPKGIIWDAISEEKLMEIPILKRLRESRDL